MSFTMYICKLPSIVNDEEILLLSSIIHRNFWYNIRIIVKNTLIRWLRASIIYKLAYKVLTTIRMVLLNMHDRCQIDIVPCMVARLCLAGLKGKDEEGKKYYTFPIQLPLVGLAVRSSFEDYISLALVR